MVSSEEPEVNPPVLVVSECGTTAVEIRDGDIKITFDPLSAVVGLRELEYAVRETFWRASELAAQNEPEDDTEDFRGEMAAIAATLAEGGPDAVIARYRERFVTAEDEQSAIPLPQTPAAGGADYSAITKFANLAVGILDQGREKADESDDETRTARVRSETGDIELELATGASDTITFLRLSREAMDRGSKNLGETLTVLVREAKMQAGVSLEEVGAAYPFLNGAEHIARATEGAAILNQSAEAQVAEMNDLVKRVQQRGGQ